MHSHKQLHGICKIVMKEIVKGESEPNTGTIALFLGCGDNVTSCHKLPSACLPDNECLYPPTLSPNNPFSPSVASARLSVHSNQKSSSYRKPVAGHTSPGGKLTFRSSFL